MKNKNNEPASFSNCNITNGFVIVKLEGSDEVKQTSYGFVLDIVFGEETRRVWLGGSWEVTEEPQVDITAYALVFAVKHEVIPPDVV